jgi:hypothetical protein
VTGPTSEEGSGRGLIQQAYVPAYVVFTDGLSTSNCRSGSESSNWCGGKWPWSDLTRYFSVCLDGLRETTKRPSEDNERADTLPIFAQRD